MILLIGQDSDPHVTGLRSCLADMGADCRVLDTVRISSQTAIVVRPVSGYLSISVRIGNELHSLEDFGSFWWRLKPPFKQPPETLDTLRNQLLREREWSNALIALEEGSVSSQWVNFPPYQRRAGKKLLQLAAAQRIGFETPDTVIGTDVEEIYEDVSRWHMNGGAIHKPLTYYYALPDKIAFTCKLQPKDLLAKAASVLAAPTIFQRNVSKAFELRVMIVGDRVATVRIDGNGSPATEQDWRRDSIGVPVQNHILDREVESKLLSLHKSLALAYAAYDFIVTPSGQHVFLECNPSGQWLWLENQLKLPITSWIAEELTARQNKIR